MKVTIFGKTGCSSCKEAERICKGAVDYEYKSLGADYSVQDYYNIAPKSVKMFPMIAIDGKYLGGLVELKEVLATKYIK